ncbi:hypothetical protein PGT21_034655 [Puccinia graminis f. sp. tritici]|uniref:Uncharacterized protein n=1 Tax=Puccinia graminis f. sp. tritici TaxID=56615 RepID=A0A5B0MNI7_PUCGR|nr:hypothetical protein PGT21_034655 [Puccinia graminis f. sp. tritici]
MKKPQGKAQRENVETPCDLSVNINSESASLNHRSTYSYVKPNHISTTSANLDNPHSLRYKKASIFSLLPTHRQLLIHQLASDSSHPPTHQRLIFKISTNSSSLRYRPQSITPNSSFFDLVKELSSKRITSSDSICPLNLNISTLKFFKLFFTLLNNCGGKSSLSFFLSTFSLPCH